MKAILCGGGHVQMALPSHLITGNSSRFVKEMFRE
jgi:hypothetical protein